MDITGFAGAGTAAGTAAEMFQLEQVGIAGVALTAESVDRYGADSHIVERRTVDD